jgi:hypothetical protein
MKRLLLLSLLLSGCVSIYEAQPPSAPPDCSNQREDEPDPRCPPAESTPVPLQPPNMHPTPLDHPYVEVPLKA